MKKTNLKSKNLIKKENTGANVKSIGQTIVTAYKLEALQTVINQVFDDLLKPFQKESINLGDVESCSDKAILEQVAEGGITWRDDTDPDSAKRKVALEREKEFVKDEWKLTNRKNNKTEGMKYTLETTLLPILMKRTEIVRGSAIRDFKMTLSKINTSSADDCASCAKVSVEISVDFKWIDFIYNEKAVENALTNIFTGNWDKVLKEEYSYACLIWRTESSTEGTVAIISYDFIMSSVDSKLKMEFKDPKINMKLAQFNKVSLSLTESFVNEVQKLLSGISGVFTDLFKNQISEFLNKKVSDKLNDLTFLDNSLKMVTYNVGFNKTMKKIIMKLGIVPVESKNEDLDKDFEDNNIHKTTTAADEDQYILARLNGKSIWKAVDTAIRLRANKIKIDKDDSDDQFLFVKPLGEFNPDIDFGGEYYIQFRETCPELLKCSDKSNYLFLKLGIVCKKELAQKQLEKSFFTSILSRAVKDDIHLTDIEVGVQLDVNGEQNLEVIDVDVAVSGDQSLASKFSWIINPLINYFKTKIASTINEKIREAKVLNHDFLFSKVQVHDERYLEVKFKLEPIKSQT